MVSFTVPPWMWRWTLPRSKKMSPCPLGFVFLLTAYFLVQTTLSSSTSSCFYPWNISGRTRSLTTPSSNPLELLGGLGLHGLLHHRSLLLCQGIAVKHSNSSRDEKEEKKKHYSEWSRWLAPIVELFLLKVSRYWDSSNIWLCRCKPDSWC